LTQAKKIRDFTEGPILPQIIRFALPLIATGILQLLFNTADIVVVGRWGGDTPEECETALAAVGSCGALINLIVNLFFGLSVGAGVCVAHDVGAKAYDQVEKTVHTSVLASLVSSVFVMAFGIFAARPLLILMGTEESVLGQAVPYMVAYFCGIPANLLYNYCASMLRSTGDTVRPLTFLSVAGVVNVVLNLIMVLVFRLGAVGVGIATAASQWVSCALIVGFMMRTDGPCHLDFRKLRIDGGKLKKIVMIGLPAGVQGTLFSLSNVLIQSSVNSFGKAVVAGNAAAANLDGYVYTSQNALYQTALTFVGQHKGAKKYRRMKKCILWCAISVVTVGLTLGMTMYLFGHPLLEIYAPGNEPAIQTGLLRMSICTTTYFLCGLMEVGSGVMRGLGRSMTSMIVSLMGSCAIRIVWIYTIFAMFPTLTMLYISYPISWGLTAATHFLFATFVLRKEERNTEEAQLTF